MNHFCEALFTHSSPAAAGGARAAVLAVRFNDKATNRIHEFLQKKNAGTITPVEEPDLSKYLRVGRSLDLLQAKARLSL